jgi:hypothetical protein
MSITENAAFSPTSSSYPGLFTQSISAGLARRLAEAATGYADEGVVYVTALYTPNFDSEDPYDVQAYPSWPGQPGARLRRVRTVPDHARPPRGNLHGVQAGAGQPRRGRCDRGRRGATPQNSPGNHDQNPGGGSEGQPR